MIEFRWVGRQLQYRERGFQVDAAGTFCGVTDFGPWVTVQQRKEMDPSRGEKTMTTCDEWDQIDDPVGVQDAELRKHCDSEKKTGTETGVQSVVMRGRWWVSWVQQTEDYRPLGYPPNRKILGWWKSGESNCGVTLCAVVEGRNESEVRDAVFTDWPEALEAGEWRFFERHSSGFVPTDRFPLSDWMIERFQSA